MDFICQRKQNKKISYAGSRRWRHLLWCSGICKNPFMAVNQLFWSAEAIRRSTLWTCQVVCPAFQQQDLALRGDHSFSRQSCPPQKTCMQMSSAGDHLSWLRMWPGPFSFGWTMPQGGSMNVVSSYLLYIPSRSNWRWNVYFHFQAPGLDAPTRMTKLVNTLPLYHLPSAGPA